MICLDGGVPDLALLMSVPSDGGDRFLLDMARDRVGKVAGGEQGDAEGDGGEEEDAAEDEAENASRRAEGLGKEAKSCYQ